MIRKFWIIIIIAVSSIVTEEVYSCQCLAIGYDNKTNLEIEIENSELILSARIIAKLDSVYPAFYSIIIENTWKGDTKDITILTTGIGGGDCGMLFEVDETYLIYGEPKDKMVYTNRCTRTSKINNTGDVDFLNYYFLKENYDTIRLTTTEFNYLKQSLKPSIQDSIFNINTSLFFYKDKLVTKAQIIGEFPQNLTIEFRYFSSGDRKLIDPVLYDELNNGVIILYEDFYSKPIKRYKLIKRMNKCTAANKWYKQCRGL